MFEYGMSRVGKNAEAYQYFSNKVTYGQLMDDIHACAAGLLELGVKKGDFVTICLPNIPQCVIALYAVNRIGAVCNLVHPLSTKTEIEKAVNLTESRFAFTFELNEGHFDGLCKTLIRCKTSEYFPKNPKGFIMKTAYNFSVRKAKRTDGINKSKNYTVVLFLSILLPLAPDDFLCYFSGLIDMSPKKFITIIAVAKPWCILFYSIFFAYFI